MEEITRPLEQIENEINFYKGQFANNTIEIGKRLIEAKALVKHGEWGNWLEEKAEFSERSARRFMQVATEFPNWSAMSVLSQTKIFALLEVPAEERETFIAEPHEVNGEIKTVDEMTTRQLQQAIKDKKALEEEKKALEQSFNDLSKKYSDEVSKPPITVEVDKTDYDSIEKIKSEKREIETKLLLLQENLETKTIEYKDNPNNLLEIESLKKQIKEKEEYVQKYKDTLTELNEKNKLVSKFMGESTNFELISTTSETTLKMMDFVKEMSKYDYLSEVFNDIPDASRREWVRSIYGVYKWSKNILNTVKHDDVIGINKNIIDVKSDYVDIEEV